MLSKRTILSQVAQIYDPIGFASAFLIRAKIGLQKLWKKGVGWDKKLTSETQEKWTNLFQEMMSLNGTSFERCLTPPYAVGRPVLCVFSDVCEDAFGSSAYARWQLSSGEYDVRYIAAKSWSFKVPSWPPNSVRPLWTNPVSNLKKLYFSWIAR